VSAGDHAEAGGVPAPPAIPLVAVGAYAPQTGFTRVLWSILTRLGAGYDIHYVGMGYKGPQFRADGVTVYPCNLRGGDVFGAYQGAAVAQRIGARAALFLNDLWMLKNYMPPFAPLGDALKIVMYVPLDGHLPNDTLLAPFSAVDRFVAYTEFGRAEMARALASLEAAGARAGATEGSATGSIDVIPHGVDAVTFHPLSGDIERQLEPGGRREAKRQAFPDRPDLHDAFLVLNANRPMPRKRVDLTIEGFARFAHGLRADRSESAAATGPDVRLVLHHAIMREPERARILDQAAQLGIADRLVLSAAPDASGITSDARLNLLYNACEVGVNTAMGEGWGLVSVEHAATGAAQIVPRHSACQEVWGRQHEAAPQEASAGESVPATDDGHDGDAAALLDASDTGVPEFSLLEMATVSADDLAAALRSLYDHPDRLRALSRAAYVRATQPAWSWAAVAARWDALLRDVIGQPIRSSPE
jgi:glycosyltransferase involved in cell wall biosynthesis